MPGVKIFRENHDEGLDRPRNKVDNKYRTFIKESGGERRQLSIGGTMTLMWMLYGQGTEWTGVPQCRSS